MAANPASSQDARETATVYLTGLHYFEALEALQRQLSPRTYLEIGTSRGDSLRLAHCRTIAVDPSFDLNKEIMGAKPALYLLQSPSAEVYARGDIKVLMPGGVDFAFIDGLHLIEAVLDDIIGCEPELRQGAVMAFHDILPINTEMTARGGNPNRRDKATRDWWTGDVWKIIPILAKHRPDLKVVVLDCQPTGLMLVSRCDKTNTTLAAKRAEILAEWRDVTLESYTIGRLYREAPIAAIKTPADIAAALHSLR